jgi:hypothetical protein
VTEAIKLVESFFWGIRRGVASDSPLPESYPIKFTARRGKVVIRFKCRQLTVSGEAGVKIAHDLMAVAEKALGGRIAKA